MKKEDIGHDDIASFSHRRLSTILRNPNHPHHAAAKAERDRRAMQRESKDEFDPHMMYDPKTGKGYKALKPADHERMKKMGYTHDKPKDVVDEEMTSTGSVVGTGDDNQTVVMRKKYDKKNKRKDQLDVLKRFIAKQK